MPENEMLARDDHKPSYLTFVIADRGGTLVVCVVSTAGGHTHSHCTDAAGARIFAANLKALADQLDPPKVEESKKEWQVIGDADGKMTAAFDAAEAASAILQNARKRSTRRPAKKARKGKRK